MLRDTLTAAMKDAMRAKEARKLSTVRLIQTAIKDRDIANRGAGKEPATDDEILQILAKMVKQREESATIYEGAARPELAAQEREEIAVLQTFMPVQMSDADVREAVAAVISELSAEGLRDMGKCMTLLRERFAGQMDFAKASAVLKEQLTGK